MSGKMEQADFSSAGPNGLLEVVAILWRLRLEAEARRPAPALRLIRVEELMAEWTVDPALEMVRDNPEAGAAHARRGGALPGHGRGRGLHVGRGGSSSMLCRGPWMARD